jgi:guanosine-3',5'-bis(diphosphate) 3'-pyrophosphohydrolase
MDIQTIYQETIIFATLKHLEKNQIIPGSDLPYVVHLSNVTMEILIASKYTNDFDLNFATRLALLHDTLEDTSATFDELEREFGIEVAEGVSALTKNESLPKEEQMMDSLNRILKLKKEVWAVKLADRITNLQDPPYYWDNNKKKKYQNEAKIILEKLKGGNEYLEKRLNSKIEEYKIYIE